MGLKSTIPERVVLGHAGRWTLVVEEGHVQPVKAAGVGEHVDPDDLPPAT
jgi:hypothetical protein